MRITIQKQKISATQMTSELVLALILDHFVRKCIEPQNIVKWFSFYCWPETGFESVYWHPLLEIFCFELIFQASNGFYKYIFIAFF